MLSFNVCINTIVLITSIIYIYRYITLLMFHAFNLNAVYVIDIIYKYILLVNVFNIIIKIFNVFKKYIN